MEKQKRKRFIASLLPEVHEGLRKASFDTRESMNMVINKAVINYLNITNKLN